MILYLNAGFAQKTELRPVSKTFALSNVHIISKPGLEPVFGTVIIKDGLIHYAGPNMTIPPDAQSIKADSMYVYAGFIDALSHTGVPTEEESKDKPKVMASNPPNDVAGITPEKKLSEVYSQKESSIKAMREGGFTISHAVPRGKMLPGKGSLILLNGQATNRALIKEDVSVYGQFKPASRMYPGTTIGVIAKWKDLYNQAKNANAYEGQYKQNQSGLKRPDYSDAVRGLFPVVTNSVPVFFKTEKTNDIHRALALSKQLGFDIVLSGVQKTGGLSSRIKTESKSLLLSLKLPKEDKSESKDKKGKDGDKEKKGEEKKDAKKDTVKKDAETLALEKRSSEFRKKIMEQAGQLEKDNVPFSFSMMDSKPKEAMSSIRRMIKNGLSEKAALAALTTNPAQLLNISSVAGTIESGKLGNLIVSTKPLFDEKSKIKYVFVEGQKFELDVKEKKKKKGASDEIVALEGNWRYEIDIPGMQSAGKMVITKAGDDVFDIKVYNDQSPDEPMEVSGIERDGNNLSFDAEMDQGGFTMNIGFDLDFDGDDVEGSVSAGEFGTFDLTGSKVSPENH